MDNSLHQSLEDHIRLQVKIGYDNHDEIIESAAAMFEDAFDDKQALRRLAARLTDSALAEHTIEQRSWVYETDCDKLDEAFAELDRNGIVARQNFTCCQTCGHTEIAYELGKTSVHRRVRGYVFFHQQDAEHVANNDTLHLAYGGFDHNFDNNDDKAVAIAHEVAAVLKKHGFAIEWNGQITKRICIKEIHWQRRRLPNSLNTV
jgi:hypothetical protein